MKSLIEKETNSYAKDFYQLLHDEGYKLARGEKYENSKEKIKTICPENHIYSVRYSTFKEGHRCRECYLDERRRKGMKAFLSVAESEGYIVAEGQDFIGRHRKIEITCPVGHTYKTTNSNFVGQNKRCDKCARLERTNKPKSLFLNNLKKSDYRLIGEYKDSRTKVSIICDKGHEYKVQPHSFNRGHRCLTCAGKNLFTTRYFKEWMFKELGDEYTVLGEYINSRTKIKIRHNNEGCKNHVWEAIPTDFKSVGTRCPRCFISKGEQSVKETLEKLGIDFVREKTFEGLKHKKPLRYDFFIEEYNTLIEYDGEHHFEPVSYSKNRKSEKSLKKFEMVKARDKLKNDFSINNGFKLIRIPYWEKDNIEKILKTELLGLATS